MAEDSLREYLLLSSTHSDEVFCKALAWAIDSALCPVTVGLYVPWGRCKDSLLADIRKHLRKISVSTDGNGKLTVKELLKLVFLMLFYIPVITKMKNKPKPSQKKNNHLIFLKFNAWHCTGCDRLWAGLVTALCDGIEEEFGLIPISIYRAVYKKDENTDEDESQNSKSSQISLKWVPKKFLRIPVFFVTLFIVSFLACALLFKILLYNNLGDSEQYEDLTDYTFYTAVTLFGGYSLLQSGTALKLIKNFIVNQKNNLMLKMKRTDMSSQLGFMNDVKEEIEIITSYLQMMEMYQNKKIKVILEISKLDKCMPDRVVEVLQAINVLLSSPDTPFICILAVDPGIIVECAEKSNLLKGMANNGYLFLNRVVTLPFSIPPMNNNTKLCCLKDIIVDGNISDAKTPKKASESEEESGSSESDPLMAVITETKDTETKDTETERENRLIKEALLFLTPKCTDHNNCREYINDNVINMRRIVNTIAITVRLMVKDNKYEGPNKVIKWVIMAAQWPFSLSWILQCIEDEQQSIWHSHCANDQDRKDNIDKYVKVNLLDIYKMSLDALHAKRQDLKPLLELDGDPEIFCELLKNTEFTVEDANMFRKYTVNLDHTIKRKIELLHGSFNILRFKEENALSRKALLDLKTPDDVCNKMDKLNIGKKKLNVEEQKLNVEEEKLNVEDEKLHVEEEKLNVEDEKLNVEEEKLNVGKKTLDQYHKLIKQHHLNGKALLYSNNEDIRNALKLTLGEWVEFRAMFLSLPTPNLYL